MLLNSAVDELIEKFKAVVEEGDILIDGGNEWFENTERRAKDLAEVGIRYLAVGVSGGEEGARKGPSMMPGGPKDAWDCIAPIFTKVAAQVDGNACTAYLGRGGSGNYVKMVHNGIEYGVQLIAEASTSSSTLQACPTTSSRQHLPSGTTASSKLRQDHVHHLRQEDDDVYDNDETKIKTTTAICVDKILDCT